MKIGSDEEAASTTIFFSDNNVETESSVRTLDLAPVHL